MTEAGLVGAVVSFFGAVNGPEAFGSTTTLFGTVSGLRLLGTAE